MEERGESSGTAQTGSNSERNKMISQVKVNYNKMKIQISRKYMKDKVQYICCNEENNHNEIRQC